jgi:hypothetical protein
MKEIKIDFSDFWGGYDPHNNFWTLVLQKLNIPYTVVSDNSDILFCSCFGINWTRKSSKKKIFWTGENWYRMDSLLPHLNNQSIINTFDLVYSFDYNTYNNHFRLPLYLIDCIEKDIQDFNLIIRRKSKELLQSEFKNRGFCTFVQGNGNCQYRNNYFITLNNYIEKIDSYGSLFNNTGKILNREEKIKISKDYKFQISFENSEYDGYVSEKIIDAFVSDIIPIYWGGSKISREFNDKSFIDVNQLGMDDSISLISNLNNDFELYWQYYNQLVISKNQKSLSERINEFYNNFQSFIMNNI